MTTFPADPVVPSGRDCESVRPLARSGQGGGRGRDGGVFRRSVGISGRAGGVSSGCFKRLRRLGCPKRQRFRRLGSQQIAEGRQVLSVNTTQLEVAVSVEQLARREEGHCSPQGLLRLGPRHAIGPGARTKIGRERQIGTVAQPGLPKALK